MSKLSLLVVVLLSVSAASAAVLEDFEGAYSGAGTLVVDPENPANTVLHLAAADGTNNAEVYQVAAPEATGVVTMRIYDFGANTIKEDSHYGPRWGVLGDGEQMTSCMNIMYRSWISGFKGYVYNAAQGVPPTPTSTLTSPTWAPGLSTAGRYVKALDDIATTGVDESQGAWATWTFKVPDAATVLVGVQANDVVDANGVYTSGPVLVTDAGPISPVGQLTGIFVSAGTNDPLPMGDLKFVGVLVDDVTFSPLTPAKPGDLDGDGDVDLDDFVILKNNFGVSDAGDCDGDGDTDLDDFVILKNNFGTAA